MKKNHVFFIFSVILTFALCNACKTNSLSNEDKLLPKVLNPMYESVQYGNERSYKVTFDLSDDAVTPDAIVLFKIKQKISESDKTGNHYDMNVITQSTSIIDFKPQGSDLPNGLLFWVNGKYHLKEVDFKKK